jgi:hypothetical protein
VVPERGPGWGTIAGLAVIAAAFSVVSSALLIFVPLGMLLVALPPRQPVLAVLGLAIVVAAFAGEAYGPLWYFERGWVLVLGGWFVLATVLFPRRRFVFRGLIAVAAATVATVLVLLPRGGALRELDFALAERGRVSVAELAAVWTTGIGLTGVAGRVGELAYALADLRATFYPALLALASLAALAISWWAFRRLAAGEPAPLRPLRDFGFPNVLVWLAAAAVVLVVAGLGPVWTRIGYNVLLFMGTLFALRGAGVALALFGSPGLVGAVAAGLLILLLTPLVLASAVLVGLSDTWLDLRSRRRLATGPVE